jgi:glucose-6-phosphate isomerase
MKINFTNFWKASDLKKSDWEKSREKIPEFLTKIKNRNQGFYQIFDNAEFQKEIVEIKNFAKSCVGKFEDIVVCGTGGSALGALAIRESLIPKFREKPRLHVLENIDAEIISELTDFLDFSQTLFIIISKSGGTIETISQYKYFRGILEKQNLEIKNHLIFITGKSGFLREESAKSGIATFSVPENIGGRFSVLTAVGLLPAALIGININELLAGAEEISRDFQSEDFTENSPFQLAAAQFFAKKSQNVLMPYSAKLKKFGNWWAQLLAESTGKDSKGITPIPAQGVTDQHSQLQLFVDGLADKLVIFMEISRDFKKSTPDLIQDKNLSKSGLKIFEKLIQAELQGTAQALTEKNRPNFTIQIDEISAKNLGKLFMLFMGATAFLGEFMEINAFDQPGVERGKVLARELLEK